MTKWMAVTLAAALAFPGVACAQAAGDAAAKIEAGKLFLNATGEVRAAPDMARVTAGVVAEADKASEAMAQQREHMNAVMAELREAGVAEADIQTTGLDLSPIYARYDSSVSPRNGDGPRITGYRASNRVTVIARDLTLVGPTLDALVDAGANTIDGVTFDIEESAALLDEARREAIATLRARAELYADAAGIEIGRILELSESGGFRPAPRMEAARALAADMATPVSGGELTLSVTVSATYEIEP